MNSQHKTLYVKEKNGRYKLAHDEQVGESAVTIVDALYYCKDRKIISSPSIARESLYLRMHREHEVFVGMFLDSKHRVLDVRELFRGTIDNTSVPVREVVKEALKINAAALIVAHNHPSGVADPSAADKSLTETLYLALGMVGIKLLDHFVFGEGGYENAVSLAEMGALQ